MRGSEKHGQPHQHLHRHCRPRPTQAPVHRKAVKAAVRTQRNGKPTVAAWVVSQRPTAPSPRALLGLRTSSNVLALAERRLSARPRVNDLRETGGSLPTEGHGTGGSLPTAEHSTDASALDRMRHRTASRTAGRFHERGPNLVRPLSLRSTPRPQSTAQAARLCRHHLLQVRGLALPLTGFRPSQVSRRRRTPTGTTLFFPQLRRSWAYRHSPIPGMATTSPSRVRSRLARAGQARAQKTISPLSGTDTGCLSDGRSNKRNRNERPTRCRQCERAWLQRASLAQCRLPLRSRRHRPRCLRPLRLGTSSSPSILVTVGTTLRCSNRPQTRFTTTSALERWSVLARLLFRLSSQ